LIWLVICVIALLLISPFAWLSFGQTVRDLPQRFLDWLQARRERRERRRIERARQRQIKDTFEWIRKGER